MPIYGYRCTQCGHELEAFQNMSDAPLRTCPECMGPLQKMLYPVGISFKGSGFYSTDYKGSKTSPNGSDGAKTESKPESPKSEPPKSKSADKSD